jgi:PIN domain nuclease of toxin-antitoxin system
MRSASNCTTLAELKQAGGSPIQLPRTAQPHVTATRSPFHGDFADRVIVATAILESALLITKYDRIRKYAAVTALW